MADGNGVLIQWNVVNWVTVVLMVTIMFFFSGLIAAFIKSNLPNSEA